MPQCSKKSDEKPFVHYFVLFRKRISITSKIRSCDLLNKIFLRQGCVGLNTVFCEYEKNEIHNGAG